MKRFRPFRHFGLKMWSVVIAILLWLVVAGEEVVERGIRVPLELQQFPAGLELQADAPSLVDVRVRGESGALSRMAPGDVIAVLDLHAVRPGRRLFQLTPEQVRVPFGVQVVQVTPPSLALVFEKSATRQVPVVPAVEGDPAAGYVVGTATSSPETVEVIGPEGAVERVREAVTEPVLVAGARQDVRDSVSIGFDDPALRLKTPRLATVTVRILPGPVERTLAGRPVRLRNLGAGLSAQAIPSTADLILRGSRQGLNRVDTESITAFVDLVGLGAGEYSLGVRVESSQDAGVARINPAAVQVRITHARP